MRWLLVVVVLAGCGGDERGQPPAPKGWVCGYSEHGGGLCFRTAVACVAHGWKDCRAQLGAAACYSFTRRLERTTSTLCRASFAGCEDDRRPFLANPDVEAVTPCERVE